MENLAFQIPAVLQGYSARSIILPYAFKWLGGTCPIEHLILQKRILFEMSESFRVASRNCNLGGRSLPTHQVWRSITPRRPLLNGFVYVWPRAAVLIKLMDCRNRLHCDCAQADLLGKTGAMSVKRQECDACAIAMRPGYSRGVAQW